MPNASVQAAAEGMPAPELNLPIGLDALISAIGEISVLVNHALNIAIDETRCGAETYELPAHFGNAVFTLNRIARDKIDTLRDELDSVITVNGGAR